MIAASISAGLKPSSDNSWVSQIAYSSAVRRELVEIRHDARSVSPSYTAKTALVFPESMASSIGFSSDGARKYFARGDVAMTVAAVEDQGAVAVKTEKAARQRGAV